MRVASLDAQIDVRVDGDAASTIVLLAGFPLSREIWNSVAERLAAKHRVVRPDLRGMGASSVAAGPYLMETLAGDVAAVFDALGLDRAAIAGHSLGGYAALAFARMFSERLERMALVCSRLSADTAEQRESREELADRLDSASDSHALVDAYADRILSKNTRETRPDIVARVRAIIEQTDPRGAAAMLRGMAVRNASDDIAPDIDVPVLVLAGGSDSVVPLDESRAIAQSFPQATFAVAQRSGHLPMLEEPDATYSALESWLAKTSAT
jgi:pimeloyl-ACP methyl ester carboxylesterase